MTTFKNNNAAYAMNAYVSRLLQENLGWPATLQNGLFPIVPLGQQPEVMQTGEPFLVYGFARYPATHLNVHCRGALTYTIYGTTVAEVNDVVAVLSEAFSRQDEAAIDINEWLVAESLTRPSGHRGVYFTTITTSMAEEADGEAADEEGGYISGVVMVELQYTQDDSNLVTAGFGA